MSNPHRASKYVPETSILKPADAALSSDDRPTFALTDAIVYRPDGVTMANALLINQDGPFVIRGRLEIEDEEDVEHLIRPSERAANIEISGSKAYSIGYDPQAVIWLAGEAGWFEINPHPSYAQIYKDMCDVSQLYYALIEIFNDAGRKVLRSDRKAVLTGLDIKHILFEYAVAVGDGTTYDETVDKCVRLGPALLAHLSIATDLPWKNTSFYKWLAREVKDKERSKRSSSRGSSLPAAASAPSPVETPIPPPRLPPASLPAHPTQLPIRRQPNGPSPGPAARESAVPLPSPASQPPGTVGDVSKEESDAVCRLYIDLIETVGRDLGDPSRLSVGKVHSRLYSAYRLKEYNTAKHLSALFSKELLESLSDAWRGGPFEAWLTSNEARLFTPASTLFLRDVPVQLVRRTTQHSGGGPSSRPGTPSSERAATTRTLHAAGKRAALRPPVGAIKRRFDGRDDSSDVAGDSDVAIVNSDVTPGNRMARRPGRPRKMAKSSHGGGESMDIDSSRQSSDEGDASHDSDADDDSGDADDNAEERKTTLIAVHSEPLLVSTRPTGPSHTWTCPHAGCHFFVRNAGTSQSDSDEDDSEGDADDDDDGDSEAAVSAKRLIAEARERIHAHLRGHEEDMLNPVDLAITEGTRGHVSVDHLLAKIRALAASKAGQSSGAPVSTNMRQLLY